MIFLDFRIDEQISTRRLRIVKYRGSSHGSDEYPFLIDESGFSILPITSLGLDYPVSTERISTGIPKLDTMLGGKGVLPGQHHTHLRYSGHRQNKFGGYLCRLRLPAG